MMIANVIINTKRKRQAVSMGNSNCTTHTSTDRYSNNTTNSFFFAFANENALDFLFWFTYDQNWVCLQTLSYKKETLCLSNVEIICCAFFVVFSFKLLHTWIFFSRHWILVFAFVLMETATQHLFLNTDLLRSNTHILHQGSDMTL